MELYDYIHEAIFEENDKHTVFYELIWELIEEQGKIDAGNISPDKEIEYVYMATAIQNIIGEFEYRVYDCVNETGFEDVVEYLGNLGVGEDEILEFCHNSDNIFDEDDDEATLRAGLDYYTEYLADFLCAEFTSIDLFNYLFTITYDFVQDFTFDFEDADELSAFIESNDERLSEYRDEYQSAFRWVDDGMIV